MQLLPGFGGGSPSVAPLPPPVVREDPAIAEAKKKRRISEKGRIGRRAAVLTGAAGDESTLTSVSRPAARGAELLGE